MSPPPVRRPGDARPAPPAATASETPAGSPRIAEGDEPSPAPTTAPAATDGIDPTTPRRDSAAATAPAPGPSPAAPRRGRLPPVPPDPLDPTTLSLRVPLPTSFPTFDVIARGITAPTHLDSSGNRLSLDALAHELSLSGNAIEQVAALIGRSGDDSPIRYQAYGTIDNARPSVANAWSRGHAECDGIMAIGAYLLVASGAVPPEDVVVSQSFAYGGWHNVVVFRDPRDGAWKVMDYQNIVTIPGATSREQALRQYFNLGSGVSVLYRIDNPNDRPVALYHVKSDHIALVDGATYAPGLSATMTGLYGTNRGLHDTDGTRSLPRRSDGSGGGLDASLNVSTANVQSHGTRVEAAMSRAPGSAEIDRIGVSSLTATGAHTAAGGKIIFHRNPGANTGSSILAAGEWWRVNGGNFLGIVGGVSTRIDVLTGHGGTPLTTVAPFVAVNGGMTHTFVDNQTIRAEVFWNAYARVTVPLTVDQGGRDLVIDSSNGNSPGGWIEPGDLVSASGLGGNLGIRTRVNLSDNLSLRAQVASHATLTDPTLAPLSLYVPFRGSVDGRLGLVYQGSRFAGQVGATATLGSLYDRDVRAGGYAIGQVRLNDQVALDLGLNGGQLVAGTRYFDARAGVSLRPGNGPVDLRLSGGATVLADPGSPAAVVPNVGLTLGGMW